MSFKKMYGFEGVGLSEVQLSISELSVVGGGGGGGWVTRQTHFMVGPSQGPTTIFCEYSYIFFRQLTCQQRLVALL